MGQFSELFTHNHSRGLHFRKMGKCLKADSHEVPLSLSVFSEYISLDTSVALILKYSVMTLLFGDDDDFRCPR